MEDLFRVLELCINLYLVIDYGDLRIVMPQKLLVITDNGSTFQ